MKGEKRKGVSSGVLRPCTHGRREVTGNSLDASPPPLLAESGTHDDAETDENERPG